MILYYALTLHQQIACMLHKELFAPHEQAHLYLSNGNNIDEIYLEQLRNSGFFAEVAIMDDQPTWGMGEGKELSDKNALDEVLAEVAELCYKSLLLPIEEYSDIYVAADHFPFGMAMVYKNIPYHYIEEATGVYCTYYLWLDIVNKQKIKLSYNVAKKYGLAGRASCVIERLIDVDKQFEEIRAEEKEKIVDFSLPKLLKKIDDNARKRILDCFGLTDTICVGKNTKNAIIMTEYLAHAKFCTWDEQREIYGRFIDYFCENMNVLIKPHPNDYQGIYEVWFPQSKQIDKSIPAELLPLVIEGGIDLCIALTSTSVYVLQENLNNTYSFRNNDLRSIKLIKQMDLYYVTMNILNNFLENASIWGVGADCLQLKAFLRNMRINNCQIEDCPNCEIPKNTGKRVIIVDALEYTDGVDEKKIQKMLRNADLKDVFVFMNTNKDVLFYDNDNEWAENTIPVCITLDKANGESVVDWIYFYTRDVNMQKEILTKKIDKMLVNAGIEVKVNCDDKSIRERVLEGMLQATEQKCNMLIKRK